MKVTTVIVAYNAEHIIGETLESVLAENCADHEMAVVNDGSTDCTAECRDRLLLPQNIKRFRDLTSMLQRQGPDR